MYPPNIDHHRISNIHLRTYTENIDALKYKLYYVGELDALIFYG